MGFEPNNPAPENFDALLEAARYDDIEDIKALSSSGNIEKNNPLHWACLNSHIEVVNELIMSGANVSALNSYNHTPMDEALRQGKLDITNAINAAVAEFELTCGNLS